MMGKSTGNYADDEEICRCSGTTAAQIKAYIEKGITNLESVSRATGACSGCGSCETAVTELLAKQNDKGRSF